MLWFLKLNSAWFEFHFNSEKVISKKFLICDSLLPLLKGRVKNKEHCTKIKDFLSKSDQSRSFLGIWSHLPKKSLMKNFIFCEWKKNSYIKLACLCIENCFCILLNFQKLQWWGFIFFKALNQCYNFKDFVEMFGQFKNVYLRIKICSTYFSQ